MRRSEALTRGTRKRVHEKKSTVNVTEFSAKENTVTGRKLGCRNGKIPAGGFYAVSCSESSQPRFYTAECLRSETSFPVAEFVFGRNGTLRWAGGIAFSAWHRRATGTSVWRSRERREDLASDGSFALSTVVVRYIEATGVSIHVE